MNDGLDKIRQAFEADTAGKTFTRVTLEQISSKYLGRKGLITQATAALKDLPRENRPQYGQALNEVKRFIESELERIQEDVFRQEDAAEEMIDMTLPARGQYYGHIHPLTQILDEIKSIFTSMGFAIEDGPEVELDHYNFELVNIPKDHPARDTHDTFFITDNVVLRTHTTPVQARVMERQKPPIRIICPGRVYRKDTPDATHSPFFHQVEGLVVDEGVGFGDLKGTLAAFVHRMFGPEIGTRFRPSYFSFTEPSAEVDMACIFCKGAGCRTCKNSGWIEIMGAGMVNPRLYEFARYEPDRYSGYAFGMGVERIAMLVYGVHDLRLFFENDIRFLHQFR